MSVRTGQSITKIFTTRSFATGAATDATGTPTGTLYVNGTADAASVTVTNITTGVYKASVTLPTLALGDVVDLRINATVAGVADNAIIWSGTKDFFAASIPDVAAGGAGGLMISGSNAGTTTFGALTVTGATTLTGAVSLGSTLGVTGTTTLAALTTTGTVTFNALTVSNILTVSGATVLTGNVSMAAGLTVTQSTLNGAGVSITGNGSGQGVSVTGGATGHGVSLTALGDGKIGLVCTGGTPNGIGIAAYGGDTAGTGMRIAGGSTSGKGLWVSTDAGDAILVEPIGGHGFYIVGAANNDAMHIIGNGTGHGIKVEAGATGNAINLSADGGHGILVQAGGTSKHGILVTGGTGGTSDALKLVAGTGGVGLRTDSITSTGAVILSSTLAVAGTTTLAAVTATGTVTFNALTVTNATTLSGAVSLGSTLGVTGTTTLAALTTTGTVTFNAFTVTNVLTVSGATTLTGAVTATNASNDIRGVNLVAANFNADVYQALIELLFTYDATATYGTANAGSLVAQIADNAGGSGLTEAGIGEAVAKKLFTYNTAESYATAIAGSVVKEIADNAGGASLTVQDIVDGVFNEAAGVHTGFITTLALQTTSTTIAGYLDTEIASILSAVDTEVATIVSQTAPAGIRTAVGLATANLDTQLAAIVGYIDTEVASILAAVDTEVGAIKTKTDFLPSATAGSAGGLTIAGNNAATTFATLTVSGATILTGNVSMAAGLTVTQSTPNGDGITITGNGSGDGLHIEGGASAPGYGIYAEGADAGVYFTGGHGIQAFGTGTGDGAHFQGGSSGDGLHLQGGSTTGRGIHCLGGVGGGIAAYFQVQAGNAPGLQIDGLGSGNGVLINAGATGDALALATTTGLGISIDTVDFADYLLDLADGVEASETLRQALRLIRASTVGKSDGFPAGPGHFRDKADSKDRITATFDGDGNRIVVATDAS